MILEPHDWEEYYEGIREDKYTSTERKFSIFVNGTDADSVCSLKILQAILMASQASISTFLVSNASALKIALEQEFRNDVRDWRTAFCINCAGTMDVKDIRRAMGEQAAELVRLVVIDSHRPIHHSYNDDNDTNNVILHDPTGEDVPKDLVPLADAAYEAQEGRPSQRRRIDENGASVDGSQDDNEREDELLKYRSQGSHYGIAASMNLFKLAHSMSLHDSFLFWMAAVGVTEQVLLRRVQLTTPHYTASLERLQDFAETMLVNDTEQGLFGEGFDTDDEDDADDGDGPQTQRKCSQGKIGRSRECKLLLYRHWSLYDSLVHSPTVMAHLRTFREGQGGRDAINLILAHAGIPIAQAKLQYSQMKLRFKSEETLRVIIETMQAMRMETARDGGGMYYDSFVVSYTSRLTLSAADHVHVLWAHLTAHNQSLCDQLETGFWEAYTATDIRSKQVKAGIELSMAQHRQLLQDIAIADPHLGRRNSVIQDGVGGTGQCLDLSTHDAWASTSPLVHPLALNRMGIILQDVEAVMNQRRTDWKYQSIVCVGPPDAQGMCMAIAIAGMKKPQKHPVTKEPLHSSFNGLLNVYGASNGLLRAAFTSSHVNSGQCDFFDSAVFTIHRHDSDVFLQRLTDEYEARDERLWSNEGLAGLLQ